MAVTETGYQNYEIYNVTNAMGPAHLEQVPLSSESTNTRVVASFLDDDGPRTFVLEGNFSITGNTLADVNGLMTGCTMFRDGSAFFSNTFSGGADFQTWVADYNYNLSLLSGNDVFTGSANQAINDAVQALDGNDVFTGYGDVNGSYSWSGGDHFYGGNGVDTAVYRGSINQYTIQRDVTMGDARSDYTTTNIGNIVSDLVSHRDGVDKFVDVERLSFSDTMLAFDIEGNAGQAYRMYKAAFDRVPDKPGLGYWIDEMDGGADLATVGNSFAISQEFINMYGANSSNSEFIGLLYEHVLHRPLDQPGFEYWNNDLNNGVSRGTVLASFAQSAENQAQTYPLIANGIEYQEWLG